MFVSILLLVLVDRVAPQQRSGASRSSTIRTIADHALVGHVISTQRCHDFMSCAFECLARADCASCNYEDIENGACELSEKGIKNAADTGPLSWRRGYVFGQLMDINDSEESSSNKRENESRMFEFTTLGTTGRTGPLNTSGYADTLLEGKVQLVGGIQIWAVPVNGSYVIEALGASGANGTCKAGLLDCTPTWLLGGLGAKIEGTFSLRAGTKLKILVGQEGHRNNNFGQCPGGGGGGSFVTLINDVPLVIAGGGGGGGLPTPDSRDGDAGQVSVNGSRCGGSAGRGGHHCNADTGQLADNTLAGGGGAGLKGNGIGFGIFTGAFSFVNGGEGGRGTSSQGGFGGGGFAMRQPGGGGGFSGGGILGASSKGYAGGGGSYNSGMLQENKAGVNKGNGRVTVTLR